MTGPAVILPYGEPGSLSDAAPVPSIFSTDPARNLGQPGISRELDQLPDDVLIAEAVKHGMPRWAAEQARHHPHCRFQLVTFYCMLLDAREGIAAGREYVDECRAAWQEMRDVELISDTPDHTVGLWER